MNAQEHFEPKTITKANVALAIIALILGVLGACVIFAWQTPTAFGSYHKTVILMAYNSAICMVIYGIILFALMRKKFLVVKLCAIFVGVISGLTLFDLIGTYPVNVNVWFIRQTSAVDINSSLMSPTTAICFLLTSISLLLLSLRKNYLIIPVVFLNLITLTITLIAILGHGIGLVPAFVWLGIKMAPHTAFGLMLFSLGVITGISQQAMNTFNQLNFFNRMVTGFGLMAVLVIAIGSIAFMQIHTVSAITHELYSNPLQINNAALRIKTEINIINRQLKNFAIRPETSANNDISQKLNNIEEHINQDVAFIRINDSTLNADLDAFVISFKKWKKFSIESTGLLSEKALDEYSSRTVHDGQEQVLAMDSILEKISAIAQQHITDLNKSAVNAENEAKNLIVVIVFGFLIVGITVASLITRSLTGQLKKIHRAMRAIAQENLTQPIPFLDHPQEIGDMARALEVFKESFSARRELEIRLSQVVEAMPNGVLMVNSSGIIEIVNAQAERIFGYNRNELLGQPVEQLIPQPSAKSHSFNRELFFKNPSTRVMGEGRELFGLRSDGKEFPMEIGLAPVNTTEGIKVLASVMDLTERRNATIALNESRERLELTTRINQIGVWEYIVNEGKLIWNDAMFDIYGRNKEYFTADYNAWRQCVHPNDIENAENLFRESIAKLTPYFCKFRIVQPDGTIKHLHAKAKVERHPNTQQVRILGTNIDITREELAVAKLHNLEALRSAIIEFSEDAIISKTTTGIVTSWNTGAYNMFGYSAEEAVGKSIKELVFPPDLVEQEEMLLAQVRAGSVIKHFETVRRCKDGRLINVSITLSPIKDANGYIVGVSAIKRDITDTIKIANMLSTRKLELEYSNSELERSNRELETFAYVASHDLKSPLRGIAQLSTWIEEDLVACEYESVNGHTALLRNRIQRMEKLLDDLLIFYRAGKSEGALMEVNVNDMVKEIFEIQNNKPGLRLELNNTLPIFTTLSTPFELIIRNLFSNAIKHHDKQEGIIQVSSRDIDEHYFEFSVCDDGPGIPEKFHSRIFGMFQTLKPRDELEGSGMGLALIKKIVENYSGAVTLKSTGRGSCFSFSWPKIINKRQLND
jgi:PAS domain S-box-containing protein